MPLRRVGPGRDVPGDINVDTARDLPGSLLAQIAHFFEHYKDLEAGKWVSTDGWVGVEEARAVILASIARYSEAAEKPGF
jgi:inorganic pyrophosphatase